MSFQEPSSSLSPTDEAAAQGGASEIANGRPIAARVIIAAALIMYFAMMGLILFRWLTLREANGLLRLHGGEDQAGAVIEVSDVGEHSIHYPSVILGPENNYVASFPLPPGTYHVRVRRGNRIIKDGVVTLPEATFGAPDPAALDLEIDTAASTTRQSATPK